MVWAGHVERMVNGRYKNTAFGKYKEKRGHLANLIPGGKVTLKLILQKIYMKGGNRIFIISRVKIFRVKLINSETPYYASFSVIYFLLYRVDIFSVLSRPVHQWSNKTQSFYSASITAYPDIPRG